MTGGDGAPLGKDSIHISGAASAATLCWAGPRGSRRHPAGCGNKAESTLGMSLLLWCWWESSPRAPALRTAALSLALPSCFLLCLIYRKRSAALLQLGLLFINSPQKTSLNAIPRHVALETPSNVHHILKEMLSVMPLPSAPNNKTGWYQLQRTHGWKDNNREVFSVHNNLLYYDLAEM